LRTRAHAAVLTAPIVVAVVAVVVLALVVGSLRDAHAAGAPGAFAAIVSGALAAAAVIRLVRRVWVWDRTLIAVTARELSVERRGLARTLHVVPLASVERLEVRQGAIGRVLGYGTIEIATRGRGRRLRFVPGPRDVGAQISARAGRAPDDPGDA